MGLLGGSVVKNLPANAKDTRDSSSVLGSGRSPRERNDNPHQYPCLENSIDRGARRATVHRVTKSRTRQKQLSTYTVFIIPCQECWHLSLHVIHIPVSLLHFSFTLFFRVFPYQALNFYVFSYQSFWFFWPLANAGLLIQFTCAVFSSFYHSSVFIIGFFSAP